MVKLVFIRVDRFWDFFKLKINSKVEIKNMFLALSNFDEIFLTRYVSENLKKCLLKTICLANFLYSYNVNYYLEMKLGYVLSKQNLFGGPFSGYAGKLV